jgi:excisionase family DNA binding protein
MDARAEMRATDADDGGTVTPTPTASGKRTKPYLVRELAEMWNVDKSTVYRMIYSGLLEAERHGPRRGAIRIPVAAVAKYLSRVTAEAVA